MMVFKGSDGVRAGWRFAGFVVILVLLNMALGNVLPPLGHALGLSDAQLNELSPLRMFLAELSFFIPVLIATYVMARLERRTVLAYGYTPSPAAKGFFVEGLALGVAAPAVVALCMLALGGMRIAGFGLHGSQWITYTLGWAVVMVLVGFSEEPMFRGYGLYALARGMGFWPAAIVMTLLFGAAHVTKPGENALDICSVMLLGFFTCFALWKTGSLWLATGFHAAFDFMQFFVIGTPNGSQTPIGRLFDVSFPGPAWVNGGVLGTEASVFAIPVTLALFAYIAWRYRETRFTLPS
ncbi:MAG TPA: type II CAAX endopeptidase family protein [Candidatus Baltobacteraceae bacterium]|nr:type II CAAX endopeptidase family protein [Candidatus Baltobacteraceae bacterium]